MVIFHCKMLVYQRVPVLQHGKGTSALMTPELTTQLEPWPLLWIPSQLEPGSTTLGEGNDTIHIWWRSYIRWLFHGISWNFMGFHGISWDFMGFHGISWDFMGFHGISWDFMIVKILWKNGDQVSIWYPRKRQQWFHILMDQWACFRSNDVVYLHNPDQKLAHTGSYLKQH